MPYAHLDAHLRQSACAYKDAYAYSFLGNEVTYQEFDRLVSHVSAFLSSLKLRHGDGMALILPNCDAFLTMYHGALRLGMYCVPINPTYTAQELFYLIEDSEVKVIVAPYQMAKLADPLFAKWPDKMLIVVGESDRPFTHAQMFSYEVMMKRQDIPPVAVDEQLNEEDIAVVLYTSGTTGHPKGAMLSHRNLASNADVIGDHMMYTNEDNILVVLPMFHVFSLTVCLNAAIYRGAHMVIQPRFSPLDALKTIEQQKITIFAGVPTMYNFMLQVGQGQTFNLHSLRYCISGGAAMPVALLTAFEKHFGVTVLEGYGLSEASPVTSFAPVDGRVRKLGSIGVSLPGVDQKIVDLEDQEVPPLTVGELVVRGPNVMKGYWHRDEDTSVALRGGWLHTGDLAKMDEEGYFYIVDRKKDMIIVGGFNVYPREVEEVLFLYPGISEAAVVGVDDGNYGEIVIACVVTKDESVTQDDIIAFCHTNLAKYKCPSKVLLMEELPKNATGKVMRRILREQIEV